MVEAMLRKAGTTRSHALTYDSARSMMLLANSVVIFEAAEPLAWKRALEPNSWPFGDLWSAFPEFANSIVLWRHPSTVTGSDFSSGSVGTAGCSRTRQATAAPPLASVFPA